MDLKNCVTPVSYVMSANSPRRSEGLGPLQITSQHQTGGNATNDEEKQWIPRRNKKCLVILQS